MESGENGRNGPAALRHAEQEQGAESENVITQSQLTEAANVKDLVLSQESAIQTRAKIKSKFTLIKWFCKH